MAAAFVIFPSGTRTTTTAVAIAVLLHKPVAAFALGSMLLRVGAARTVGALARPIAFFAATSPVGVLIGMALVR